MPLRAAVEDSACKDMLMLRLLLHIGFAGWLQDTVHNDYQRPKSLLIPGGPEQNQLCGSEGGISTDGVLPPSWAYCTCST